MSFIPNYMERNMPIFSPASALAEMERMLSFSSSGNTAYPPYNLAKTGSETFVLEFALAGFSKKDLSIKKDNNALIIVGSKQEEKQADERTYLHKGIGMRKFSRTFQLPEFFEVSGARMSDGILTVELERKIPEEKKPIDIAIK